MVFKKRKTVPFLSEQRKKQPCEIRKAAFISQRELLVVGLNRFRRSTAGNEDLNDGVAAETVAAMDTAGDFASRIQAGDHVAIGSSAWRSVSTLIPPMVWWVDGAMKRIRSSTPSSL